ncbi:rab-GTPase-TBC domain-containing protein [Radiomyces spectabilis]|uniref:rab-GTPase-TBC domain-containing protein n=1 Tax=Radiomyces spectabilis TaxID=64574 RepID=UPI00221FDF7A|nr:rab-GTPase-TBC domain-containing protein [Radiomyces spectabilis]KAI8369369.1 rab-GTPase-TBC domain-containing protein [Radiomyces spectabilis]
MVPDTNPKLQALQRVLLAFSIYSPHIGYCQSLNYLVGFFLLFVDSEEEAFWLLQVVVYDYLPENVYDVTMEGANIDQTVLMLMISEKMPEIWAKIAGGSSFWTCEQTDGLPPITLVTSHWFLTLFINILPVETVLRIWDCFFMEGYHIMFQVALTIIQLNEEELRHLDDPIDVFHILQSTPKRLIDCHYFMEVILCIWFQ